MLTEPQKLWVAALRSGEYEQGRFALCAGNRYCCLGVACELYIQHVDSDFLREDADEYIVYDGSFHKTLPPLVQEWLQMRTADGVLQEGSLASRNDDYMPFDEIADVIESEPDGLFKIPQEVNHD